MTILKPKNRYHEKVKHLYIHYRGYAGRIFNGCLFFLFSAALV